MCIEKSIQYLFIIIFQLRWTLVVVKLRKELECKCTDSILRINKAMKKYSQITQLFINAHFTAT